MSVKLILGLRMGSTKLFVWFKATGVEHSISIESSLVVMIDMTIPLMTGLSKELTTELAQGFKWY